MQNPRNLSWNQFNESRRFPLLYDCSAQSEDGHFIIPDDLITGLYISHGINTLFSQPGFFYIGEFVYFRSGFSLSVYYRSVNGTSTRVAETTVDLTAKPYHRTTALLGVTPTFLHGYLVLGETAGLEKQPAGEWSFPPDATILDPFCVRFIARELSALYIRNENSTAGPFYGDVVLSAGDRIRLDVRGTNNPFNCLELPSAGLETGTEVVVTALNEDTEQTVTAIRTINGIGPDAAGNITFVGRSCLSITPQGNTLIFDDKCSEPCCTCTELAPIEEKVKELQQSSQALGSHVDSLGMQIDFLSQSVTSFR
jgi:hypothetical protein